MKIADGLGLDLVCIEQPADGSNPLCKAIDYGKWKYDSVKKQKKHSKENKKTTKEIRFSLEIQDHDIEHKLNQAQIFLNDGDDVLFTMRLKGRQRRRMSEAVQKMKEIVASCSEYGKEVDPIKTMNGSVSVRMTKVKGVKQ
jgi:translation initiation factor IF-3